MPQRQELFDSLLFRESVIPASSRWNIFTNTMTSKQSTPMSEVCPESPQYESSVLGLCSCISVFDGLVDTFLNNSDAIGGNPGRPVCVATMRRAHRLWQVSPEPPRGLRQRWVWWLFSGMHFFSALSPVSIIATDVSGKAQGRRDTNALRYHSVLNSALQFPLRISS